MSYSTFLSDIIKDSGKSLRQISLECKNKYNVTATASYISKLQTGSQTPASDKVNIAIAKVCKINPEDLIFEAYFERSPEIVKDTINKMINFIKNMYLSLLTMDDIKRLGIENEIQKYLNMNTRQFVQEMVNDNTDYESPLEINIPMNKSATTSNDEAIKEMFMKFSIGFKMLDSSMIPIIPEGAKIELDNTKELKNGDIVVVVLDDNNYIIRTYVKNENVITLIPSNKLFETKSYNEKDIIIKGRVKSITTEL